MGEKESTNLLIDYVLFPFFLGWLHSIYVQALTELDTFSLGWLHSIYVQALTELDNSLNADIGARNFVLCFEFLCFFTPHFTLS